MDRDQHIVTPEVAHLKGVVLEVQYHVRGVDYPSLMPQA